MNEICHFQKFKIEHLEIEKKISDHGAALFFQVLIYHNKILVGFKIYLKKSTQCAIPLLSLKLFSFYTKRWRKGQDENLLARTETRVFNLSLKPFFKTNTKTNTVCNESLGGLFETMIQF